MTLKGVSAPGNPEQAERMWEQLEALRRQHALRYPPINFTQAPPGTDLNEMAKLSLDVIAEERAAIKALMGRWTRPEKEALLNWLLPKDSVITLHVADEWLERLICWRPARILEAQRLKKDLTPMLSAGQKALLDEEGDAYFLRLAQSYQGSA